MLFTVLQLYFTSGGVFLPLHLRLNLRAFLGRGRGFQTIAVLGLNNSVNSVALLFFCGGLLRLLHTRSLLLQLAADGNLCVYLGVSKHFRRTRLLRRNLREI